jgi:predicted AlkP superfamily pyrophosphatase or phosphodiesterase
MAERYFDFKYRKKNDYLKLISDRRDAYLINLKFVDSLVGEVFNEIEKNDNYKKNETLIILSSDHWAKGNYGDFITRSIDDKNPYPSLFLAKIIGDDEQFDIHEPDSGIHVQELIHEFLREKISSHADINKFFSEKKGYSIYVDSEVQFNEKNDF